jgi:transcriptional regulator with XRE-family HTH domain
MRTTRTARFRLQRLGAELRRLRDDAGMTVRDAGQEMHCSASKISRQESGQAGIGPGELDRLLHLYGVPEQDRERYRALLGQEYVRDWWTRYEDVLSPSQFEHVAMENIATSTREYQLTAIPGLLQTRDYARAINVESVRSLSPEQIEATVEVRLRRQRRLIDEPKLDLLTVIWEGALALETGGPKVMRGQLAHLLSAASAPNVTVRVVPLSNGRRGVLGSAFQILGFASPHEPDQLFIESLKGMLTTGYDREVAQGARLFAETVAVSLDPRASAKLITARMKGL